VLASARFAVSGCGSSRSWPTSSGAAEAVREQQTRWSLLEAEIAERADAANPGA
jgi:hypothetical protein